MNTVVRWQTPWPQWRSHWQVLHAWPPGAQWLMLSLISVCMTAAGSFWWSSEAWEIWWQADEQLQQLDEDILRHQQQVKQLRQRIREIQALPHPSGWPVPAWQTWPQTPPPDDNQALQQWLNWGRQHGLAAQAMPLTGESAVRWRGSLPALIAAVHGLPQEFPAMRLSGLDWQALPAQATSSKLGLVEDRLQVELQWTRARDNPLAVLPAKNKKPAEKTAVAVDAPPVLPPPAVASAKLYNPFKVTALRSGLPPDVAQKELRGWPVLHHQPVSQLRWVGSLSRHDQRQGLLAFNGLVYSVQKGDHLGQDWGEVTDIARDHVLLREWHAHTNGEWQPVTRRIAAGDPK